MTHDRKFTETVSAEPLPFDEKFLRNKLNANPGDWEMRRQLAQGLYDKQHYEAAAKVVWDADEIPSTDLDLAFAARILAKARPRRAIRLLTAVLELNRGKAVQNMGMANALLHHGMVLQAGRFYGAALEADPTLANPEIEHFVLWTDDECALWGNFEERRPKLGDLPWMMRDPKEALKLTSSVKLHTTPLSVPSLPVVAGEELHNELYKQEASKNGKITPPPAVTIPIDRVAPKDRRFDSTFGAAVVGSDTPAESGEPPVPSGDQKGPASPVAPAAKVPPAIPKPSVVPEGVPKQIPVYPAPVPGSSTKPRPTVPLKTAPGTSQAAPAGAGPRTRRLLVPPKLCPD